MATKNFSRVPCRLLQPMHRRNFLSSLKFHSGRKKCISFALPAWEPVFVGEIVDGHLLHLEQLALQIVRVPLHDVDSAQRFRMAFNRSFDTVYAPLSK